MSNLESDYLIIGAGIAGASVAYWLAPHGRTVLLERESQPGYHSTGRSAAMLIDSYGPRHVRALTRASRAFFESPPDHFGGESLLKCRGTLTISENSNDSRLLEHFRLARETCATSQLLDGSTAVRLVPVLRPEVTAQAVLEPDAADIDVHALHQGYLSGARRSGCELRCGIEIVGIERRHEGWRIVTTTGSFVTRILVNAAGAWCDVVAQLAGVAPIGLVPKRRSAFMFDPPNSVAVGGWPMCAKVDWSWYMKPEGGRLLGSPANADAVTPQDVQPEDLDIALGIEAIESATTIRIDRPTQVWAGLRSFVSDEELVGGFEQNVEQFFWIAGQGGYGIQTSPAMGESCAALVRGLPIPEAIASAGVTAAALSPNRLR
jgi:D-arginine dehydrogenase